VIPLTNLKRINHHHHPLTNPNQIDHHLKQVIPLTNLKRINHHHHPLTKQIILHPYKNVHQANTLSMAFALPQTKRKKMTNKIIV
jgi:hypothetical protein